MAVKTKARSKRGAKKPAPKKAAARTTTRKATTAKAAPKYEEPGAPWWKRVPLPQPK